MFMHPKFVYKQKIFPKFQSFFFPETLKNIIIIKKYQYFYDNSSEISETSDNLWMHFGKTRAFAQMLKSDWLRVLVHSPYCWGCREEMIASHISHRFRQLVGFLIKLCCEAFQICPCNVRN